MFRIAPRAVTSPGADLHAVTEANCADEGRTRTRGADAESRGHGLLRRRNVVLLCIYAGLGAILASCSLSPTRARAQGRLDERISTAMYGTGPFSTSELGSEFRYENHYPFDYCRGSGPPVTETTYSSDYDTEAATARITQIFEQAGWTKDESRVEPAGQALLRSQVDGYEATIVVRSRANEGRTAQSPGTRRTVTSVTGEILGSDALCSSWLDGDRRTTHGAATVHIRLTLTARPLKPPIASGTDQPTPTSQRP